MSPHISFVHDGVLAVVPSSLDELTTPAVQDACELAARGSVVVDLSAVTSVDPHGLRALLDLTVHCASRGGTLTVRGVSASVVQSLAAADATGLVRIESVAS